MNILFIILIIILICLLVSIIITYRKLSQLKIEKKETQFSIQTSQKDYDKYLAQKNDLIKEIQNLKNQKTQKEIQFQTFLAKKDEQTNEQINKIIQEYQKRIQQENDKFQDFRKNNIYGFQKYFANIEQAYQKIDTEYQEKIQKLESRRAQVQCKLQSVKASLQAAAAASLREREKAEKIQFYKIQITDLQKSDIQKIWPLRNQLHDSSLVSKVIWTSYIQKATTQMCNRILTQNNCGIYRITDLLTNQCYIGQSVDISTRWKTHVKAGLGINNSNNKLYATMLKDGVWNFSFELLEACNRNELDAKEKYWINMYNSNELGLNGNKGNKTL